jgi:hypothetical protein
MIAQNRNLPCAIEPVSLARSLAQTGWQRSNNPPSDKQIEFLADRMRQRGEPASAVLDDQGRLSSRDAWQVIDARKAVRP